MVVKSAGITVLVIPSLIEAETTLVFMTGGNGNRKAVFISYESFTHISLGEKDFID